MRTEGIGRGGSVWQGVRLSRADHAPAPDIKMSAPIRMRAVELITQWGTWFWPEQAARSPRDTGISKGDPIRVQSQSILLNTSANKQREC